MLAGMTYKVGPKAVRLLGLLADVPGGGTVALEASRRQDRELEESKLRRLIS